MSLLSETVDYNNQALAWRLPLKKCIEIKSVDIIPGETVTIQLNDTSQLTGMPDVNYEILHSEPNFKYQCNNPPLGIENQTYLQDIRSLEQVINTSPKVIKKNKPKKKVNRLPFDGTLYHSQQLGLKVPPKQQLGTRGRIIHSQAREVIHNVFKFMKDEARNGIRIPISNYRARVLKATGISKCTYSKITTREFKRGEPQPTTKKKINGVKVDNMEQNNVSENDSIYRPKINRDASTPDGVYNLEDLVEAYILDTLAVEAGNIIQAGSADQFGLCPFATSNINKILISASQEEEKIRSITIFLYIQYLIKFMVTPMKLVTKKFVVCDKSVDVNNHILNLFSEMGSHGRTRPLHMKDKALCYTMVLAAIAMDFEVDVELLSKDMKIGIKKAIEVARILAFNAKANNKNVVQLKLPLPAPVNFTPKKGRR
ncbi:uncharacterized protein Polr1E isoform X1 [Diabrotica undecimpunctata]|uniref:uncharacterized protein Polr1E isoform X1 n=1 Tax=Diabrotica undecimpunctata TaxID=50387 RepID=UPI003B639C8B